MAAAFVLVALGQFAVLALEFLIVTVTVFTFLLSLEEWFVFSFIVLLVVTGLFVCWLVVTRPMRWLYPSQTISDRIAHDGVADAVETIGESLLFSRALVNWPKLLAGLVAALVGTFVGFALADQFAWHAVIDPMWAATVVGVLAVLVHLVWIVYTEWTDDAAALRELEESVRVLEQPTDELAEQRAAVQARVDRLARQADVPSPTVELGTSPSPTAATVGYRPASSTVVVSRGLVDALEDRELDAVLAHELAHVQNRDAAVVTALSMPAAYASAMIDRYEHGAVLIPAGIVIAVVRWSVAIVSRYREHLADEGAVAITGDPAAMASALETLDRDLSRRPTTDARRAGSSTAFAIVPPPWEEHRFFDGTRRFVDRKLFGTHPPTAKRIDRLRRRA